MLSILNQINIFNIENETTIWSELLKVVDNKQTQKILNSKEQFINFCLKIEKKVRKIIKLQNNETSHHSKEKLLINGLVYIELVRYDDSQVVNWENLNFNKSTLKEYWEAKKHIRSTYKSIKENIEDELLKLFKKISSYKQKTQENSLIGSLSVSSRENSPTKIYNFFNFNGNVLLKNSENNINKLYFYSDEEEMLNNLEENNKKVQILDFMSDIDFKCFVENLSNSIDSSEEMKDIKFESNKIKHSHTMIFKEKINFNEKDESADRIIGNIGNETSFENDEKSFCEKMDCIQKSLTEKISHNKEEIKKNMLIFKNEEILIEKDNEQQIKKEEKNLSLEMSSLKKKTINLKCNVKEDSNESKEEEEEEKKLELYDNFLEDADSNQNSISIDEDYL